MGERYIVSGTQLGMLISAVKKGDKDLMTSVIKVICDDQHLGKSKVSIFTDTVWLSELLYKRENDD